MDLDKLKNIIVEQIIMIPKMNTNSNLQFSVARKSLILSNAKQETQDSINLVRMTIIVELYPNLAATFSQTKNRIVLCEFDKRIAPIRRDYSIPF